jgi:antitoxin YefM
LVGLSHVVVDELKELVILMVMESMPLAEVKAHLSEVVSRVNGQHERVTVTVHGQASALIMSPDDLERLEETIAVLANETLIRELTASEGDLVAGRVEDADSLAAAMRARKLSA